MSNHVERPWSPRPALRDNVPSRSMATTDPVERALEHCRRAREELATAMLRVDGAVRALLEERERRNR